MRPRRRVGAVVVLPTQNSVGAHLRNGDPDPGPPRRGANCTRVPLWRPFAVACRALNVARPARMVLFGCKWQSCATCPGHVAQFLSRNTSSVGIGHVFRCRIVETRVSASPRRSISCCSGRSRTSGVATALRCERPLASRRSALHSRSWRRNLLWRARAGLAAANDEAPRPMVIPLGPGSPLILDGDVHALPSAEDPEATVFRGSDGLWRIERRSEVTTPLEDQTRFEIGGRAFRFTCPVFGAQPASLEQPELRGARLVLGTARDGSRTHLRVETRDAIYNLGARPHHDVLLALAHHRLADTQRAVPDSSAGWAYEDDVVRELGIPSPQIHVDVLSVEKGDCVPRNPGSGGCRRTSATNGATSPRSPSVRNRRCVGVETAPHWPSESRCARATPRPSRTDSWTAGRPSAWPCQTVPRPTGRCTTGRRTTEPIPKSPQSTGPCRTDPESDGPPGDGAARDASTTDAPMADGSTPDGLAPEGSTFDDAADDASIPEGFCGRWVRG